MKKEIKLKKRLALDVYIHESFLDAKVRKALGVDGANIYQKRPNKHYKQFLLIESEPPPHI